MSAPQVRDASPAVLVKDLVERVLALCALAAAVWFAGVPESSAQSWSRDAEVAASCQLAVEETLSTTSEAAAGRDGLNETLNHWRERVIELAPDEAVRGSLFTAGRSAFAEHRRNEGDAVFASILEVMLVRCDAARAGRRPSAEELIAQ